MHRYKGNQRVGRYGCKPQHRLNLVDDLGNPTPIGDGAIMFMKYVEMERQARLNDRMYKRMRDLELDSEINCIAKFRDISK